MTTKSNKFNPRTSQLVVFSHKSFSFCPFFIIFASEIIHSLILFTTMLTIKAGEIAGKIWTALNEKGTLTGKELKKACGKLTDKDLFLGLGWLLREEKIETAEIEKDITVKLK